MSGVTKTNAYNLMGQEGDCTRMSSAETYSTSTSITEWLLHLTTGLCLRGYLNGKKKNSKL